MEHLPILYTNMFIELCKMNCYENAKHFYETYTSHIDIHHNNDEIFKFCCKNKYHELANWFCLIIYNDIKATFNKKW